MISAFLNEQGMVTHHESLFGAIGRGSGIAILDGCRPEISTFYVFDGLRD